MIPSSMFQKIFFLLICLVSMFAYSQSYIEDRYEELLEQNDCGDWLEQENFPCALRLKNSNGEWKKPSSVAINFVKNHKTSILEYAKIYGIAPEAIAAVFIAEGTVNINLDDKIQNLLSQLVGEKLVMKLGKMIGLNISLGPAQINEQGLIQALDVIRSVEKKNISLEKLKEEIMWGNDEPYGLICPTLIVIGAMIHDDTKGSIRIVAALLHKAQQDYQKKGVDISKNLGALVTLYNLGKTQEKAQAINDPLKYIPKVNFLGLFAQKYQSIILQSLK